MSRVYLHENNKFNKLIKLLFCLLGVFFIYGFYKNGISLYLNHSIELLDLFKPIIFTGLSILISFVSSKMFKEGFISYRLLSNILISLVTLVNTNILIYIVLLIIINGIYKCLKINMVSFYMILLIIISILLKNYTFLNVSESALKHSYGFSDYILGRGYGAVGNTFLLMSIISFIILICNREYKRQIPIWGFIILYFLLMIKAFVTSEAPIDVFLNNNIIFAFVFIAPISIYSPYCKGSCYIYGVLLGLITFLGTFIDSSLVLYIGITLLSFIAKYIDKFIARN